MRFCVFGDIHGNVQALDAMVAQAATARVDRYLCLGDIVGYGAAPSECIKKVRDLDAIVVAGNHDWAVVDRLSLDYFNKYAGEAIEWTRAAISKDDYTWLERLPLKDVRDGVTIAHGTIHDPKVFDYMQTSYDAYLSFNVLETRVGFVGHSHVPVAFTHGVPITYSLEKRVTVGESKCIANPGSVGQPRDENPRAAYLVYDDQTSVIEFHRVDYDVDGASNAIHEAGLPAVLAERLHAGR